MFWKKYNYKYNWKQLKISSDDFIIVKERLILSMKHVSQGFEDVKCQNDDETLRP